MKSKQLQKRKNGSVVKRTSEAELLLDTMESGGILSMSVLAEEMDIPRDKVRKAIAQARENFRNGVEGFDRWIYTTKGGYTLEEKAEHAAYETRMRFSMGFGVIANGQHVYKALRKLNFKMFEGMKLEFKPKMLVVDSFRKK